MKLTTRFFKVANDIKFKIVKTMQDMEFPSPEFFEAVLTLGLSTMKPSPKVIKIETPHLKR